MMKMLAPEQAVHLGHGIIVVADGLDCYFHQVFSRNVNRFLPAQRLWQIQRPAHFSL
jgi:hypothetical protein